MKVLGCLRSPRDRKSSLLARRPRADFALQLHLHNYQGKKLVSQHLPHTAYGGAHSYNGHRGELHKIVYDHAVSLGIPIRLGCNVTEYWETPDKAGVVCNGERMEADLVVGADGVRSKARTLVLVTTFCTLDFMSMC